MFYFDSKALSKFNLFLGPTYTRFHSYEEYKFERLPERNVTFPLEHCWSYEDLTVTSSRRPCKYLTIHTSDNYGTNTRVVCFAYGDDDDDPSAASTSAEHDDGNTTRALLLYWEYGYCWLDTQICIDSTTICRLQWLVRPSIRLSVSESVLYP